MKKKLLTIGYYEAKEVKRCASVDEDSLDSCQPVKCLVKYSGKRNFFNKSLRRCQPVVVWVPDSGEAADSVSEEIFSTILLLFIKQRPGDRFYWQQ